MTQVDQKALEAAADAIHGTRGIGGRVVTMPEKYAEATARLVIVAYLDFLAQSAKNPDPAESEMPELSDILATFPDSAKIGVVETGSGDWVLPINVGQLTVLLARSSALDEARASGLLAMKMITHYQEHAEAAEALLRQQPAVAVKPLEWVGNDPDYTTATSLLGRYEIINTFHETGFMAQFAGSKSATYYSSLEDAKAAAQADYEQRIRSALEPQLLQNPPQLPDGWVMVPKDPTPAMVEAGNDIDWSNEDERASAINLWHAMLAASPSQNVEG